MHAARLIPALGMRDDEPARVARLRQILRRAQARGLDPVMVYRKATEVYGGGSADIARPTAPPYEQVRPDRAAPSS